MCSTKALSASDEFNVELGVIGGISPVSHF
jgi:hypothetical protein